MSARQMDLYNRSLKIIAGIGTTMFVGVNVLPHVFPRTVIDLSDGMPESFVKHINPKYKELLKETCQLMNIEPDTVELTHSRGLNTLSAGCPFLPNKSVVVLPRNTLYTHPDHLMHAGITFSEAKTVDWNSSAGKTLKEVLILNNDEIRFLIGHELTHIRDYHFVASTLHSTGMFYSFYKLSTLIPKIPKTPMALGPTIFLTIGIWLLGIPFYFATKKPLCHCLEYSADETSAKLGEQYCKGGISYTRKKLKLNRVLRVTTENGFDCFSKVGNNIGYLDSFGHPKRTDRLKQLKEISKNLYNVDVPIDVSV